MGRGETVGLESNLNTQKPSQEAKGAHQVIADGSKSNSAMKSDPESAIGQNPTDCSH